MCIPVMIFFLEQEILYFKNFDLENVITPVDADKLEELLTLSN